MAITFPRPLLAIRYVAGLPELALSVSQSRSGSRLTNVVEWADPLWTVGLETGFLRASDLAMVRAWWDSLRGGLRSVAFRSPVYCTPRAHIGARGPETTAGSVSAKSGDAVTVGGVNAALALSPGDFVSFEAASGARALGRVTEATGAGASRVLAIEPPLPASIPVGATVRFDRAAFTARPLADSFEAPRIGPGRASFTLLESRT